MKNGNEIALQKLPILEQSSTRSEVSLTTINRAIQPANNILDVSGYGNNCGLFALALGVKIAIQKRFPGLRCEDKLSFLHDISMQTFQQTTSETAEVGRLLREALSEAFLQDSEFKATRLENFIASCVLYIKKGGGNEFEAFLLDRRDCSADMEALIKSNQLAMNAVWDIWSEIEGILKLKQQGLTRYINDIDYLCLTHRDISEYHQAITQLLSHIDKQNCVIKVEQLLTSYDYPQADPIKHLLRLRKLSCAAWKKITTEGSVEKRKIFKDTLNQYFQKYYINLLIKESSIDEISNILFIFALIESIDFDANAQIINNPSFTDILETACSFLARLEINKKWELFYTNYARYVKEHPVMLSADELDCLARYWNVQLIIEFRNPIVRKYKTYEQIALVLPHVTLCNLNENHWQVVFTENIDTLKYNAASVTKHQLEELESNIKLYEDVEPLAAEITKHQISIPSIETTIKVNQQSIEANLPYNKILIVPLQFQELKSIIDEIKSNQAISDYALQAEAFIKLGDYYYKQKEYLYTAAIYNYVLNIYCMNLSQVLEDKKVDQIDSCSQNIINKLVDVEKQFITELGIQLQRTTIDNNYDYLKSNTVHKVYLQQLREDCKRKLEELDQQYPFDIYDEEKIREQQEKYDQLQLEKAEFIHKLYNNITKKLKIFIRKLIQECIDVLGDPPCEYAVISLGSLARKEATPYSDLEFAILIEEDIEDYKKYFRNLTKLLYLKVINLGETILPALAIPALNNYYSSNPLDNWFYDKVTPRGFAFDGAMPQACKTPLGEKDEKGINIFELIHTPKKMSSLCHTQEKLLKDRKLYNVLTNVAFICGKKELMNQYELISSALNISFKNIATELLLNNAWEFEPKIGENSIDGQPYEVKKQIYRTVDRIIDNLALYFNLKTKNAWDSIEKMYTENIINLKASHNLKIALSIAIELRLRTYISQNGQREYIELKDIKLEDITREVKEGQIEKNFIIPSRHMLFRYYYTAVPLHRTIALFCIHRFKQNNLKYLETSIVNINFSITKHLSLLNSFNMTVEEAYQLLESLELLLEKRRIDRNAIIQSIPISNYQNDQYAKFKELANVYDLKCTEMISLVKDTRNQMKNRYNNLSHSGTYTGSLLKYLESLKNYQESWVLGLKQFQIRVKQSYEVDEEDEKALAKVLLKDDYYTDDLKVKGLIYKRLKQYEIAKKHFEKAYSENPNDIYLLNSLAAICIYDCSNYEDAEKYYKEGLLLSLKQDIIDDIYIISLKLAAISFYLNDKDCTYYHELAVKALVKMKRVYPNNCIIELTSNTFYQIEKLHSLQLKFEETLLEIEKYKFEYEYNDLSLKELEEKCDEYTENVKINNVKAQKIICDYENQKNTIEKISNDVEPLIVKMNNFDNVFTRFIFNFLSFFGFPNKLKLYKLQKQKFEEAKQSSVELLQEFKKQILDYEKQMLDYEKIKQNRDETKKKNEIIKQKNAELNKMVVEFCTQRKMVKENFISSKNDYLQLLTDFIRGIHTLPSGVWFNLSKLQEPEDLPIENREQVRDDVPSVETAISMSPYHPSDLLIRHNIIYAQPIDALQVKAEKDLPSLEDVPSELADDVKNVFSQNKK